MGPGLLESLYRECLLIELGDGGIDVRMRARRSRSTTKGVAAKDAGSDIDLLVERTIIVELKAVEALAPGALGAGHDLPASSRAIRPDC